MNTSIGGLRQRLVIKRLTVTVAASGDHTQTWTRLATVWGSVLPTREESREGFSGATNQTVAQVSHDVRVRASSAVSFATLSARDRFEWGSRLLQIETITDPDGRGRWLVCKCSEVA